MSFINLPSTELNCVHSALKLICNTTSRNKMLPVYTFDEALRWKALLVTVPPNCDPGTTPIGLGSSKSSWFFLVSLAIQCVVQVSTWL